MITARTPQSRRPFLSPIESLEGRRLFAAFGLTDLTPNIGGVTHTGTAYGVSNNGKVALSYDGDAASWAGGTVSDLGFAGRSLDINNEGVVCGADTSTGVDRPFIVKNGVKTIYSIDAVTNGVANAINASGEVVGTMHLPAGDRGFYIQPGGAAHGIGVPAGYTNVQANGVNDAGQIVGTVTTSGGLARGFIYSNSTFKLLEPLPGGTSSHVNHGIQNNGTPLAYGGSADLYTDGTTHIYHAWTVGSNGYGAQSDRGAPSGTYDQDANDINTAGVIVSTVIGGMFPEVAYVNTGGTGWTSLTGQTDAAWSLFEANAINDSNQIVGFGFTPGGDHHAYLLTPTAAPVETAKIGGRVFNDADSDGVRDAGEAGLAGVTVTLARSGFANKTFVTGASGEFSFQNLPAGTYTVSQTLLTGNVATTPPGGTYTVVVSAGQIVGDRLFGQHHNEVAATFKISGKLWNDADGDGIFDAGESTSGVRTVYIDANGNGQLDAGEKQTQSNAGGEYSFSGLANGTYKVTRVFPAGYHLSNGPAGYIPVTINGANQTGINLGSSTVATPPAMGSISGVLWNDADADGIFDNGESASGIRTVFIDTNGNKQLDAGERSVQSNGEGRYTFDNLVAGTYRITRVFPAGYKLSNNNDGFITVNLSSGQMKTGVNLGTKSVA